MDACGDPGSYCLSPPPSAQDSGYGECAARSGWMSSHTVNSAPFLLFTVFDRFCLRIAQVPHSARPGIVDLEAEFQNQLPLPRADGQIGDLPEGAIADAHVGRAEDGMVEGIVGFQAQLQPYPFMPIR